MADYYSLLLRSLENVADPRPETRRKVYERARSVLLAQLRGLQPPLSEAEIIHECMAFDDAVLSVEQLYQNPQNSSEPNVYTPGVSHRDYQNDYGHYSNANYTQQGYSGYDQNPYPEAPQNFSPQSLYPNYQENPQGYSPSSEYNRSPQNYGYQPPYRQNEEQYPSYGDYNNHNQLPPHETQPNPHYGSPQEYGQEGEGYGHAQYGYPFPQENYYGYGQGESVSSTYSNEGQNFQQQNHEGAVPQINRDYRPRVVFQSETGEKERTRARYVVLGVIGLLILIVSVLALVLKHKNTEVIPPPPLPVVQTAGDGNGENDNPVQQPSDGRTQVPKLAERVNAAPVVETNDNMINTQEDNRAFLIEEVPLPPPHNKKTSSGNIIWSLEKAALKSEDETEVVGTDYIIRGKASFPSADLVLDLQIRKNRIKTVAASHTILFQFSSFSGKTNINIKKFIDFLITPQPDRSEKTLPPAAIYNLEKNAYIYAIQNMDVTTSTMLQRLGWFRVVVLNDSDLAAALYFEKGPDGQRIFDEAFRSWNE